MTKYYERAMVISQGVPAVSLDRWSKMFRDTPFVVKEDGKRLLYSEDFVTFALCRAGKTGPASMPKPMLVVSLFQLVREESTLSQIAKSIGEPEVVVSELLAYLGLKVDDNAKKTENIQGN